MHMVLASVHVSGFLIIADVEFYWNERDLLIISPIYKEDFGIGGRAQYEVKYYVLIPDESIAGSYFFQGSYVLFLLFRSRC